MAKIVKFILTYDRRGLGTIADPIRLCPQLYTVAGELVAECDPMPKDDPANPKMFFDISPAYRVD